VKRVVLPLLLLLVLLGIWELYVDLGGVDPIILPSPHVVAQSLWTDRSLLWSSFLVTAKEVVLGIAVAVIAGFVLTIAIHFSETLRRVVYPLLVGSQAVPVIVIAPILVSWLGFGLGPKLVVIGLVSFFPIVVTMAAGLASVDADLIKLMRTFDAPRWQTFRLVELPAALPGLLTGIRIAVAISVIGAVFAEWVGSNSGLGYLIEVSLPQLLTARAVAAVVILCVFAVALFGLLTLAERLAVPWAYQVKGERSR
jgi:ABC-type nitrate/sulfonate/bicarbonate transport system permease component